MQHRNDRSAALLVVLLAIVGLQCSESSAQSADSHSAANGFWLGILQLSKDMRPLRLQLTVSSDNAGREVCTVDSLDEGIFDLTCANVSFVGRDLTFEVPEMGAHWSGKLSADGNSLIGVYSQRIAGPLNFNRTDARTPAPQPYEAFYDPPRRPMTADDMQHALDTDVIKAIKSGAFARETSVGVAVGVYRKGARRIFAYGAAKPEAIFELGSLTKTFTGLVLAQMVVLGKVRLDEPIRELWPPGTVDKPGGSEVTLLDLITHRSGLPSWPDNPAPPGPDNPYPNYSTAMLHEFVAKHGVAKPADASFQYSNLGAGLLGQALADHSATTYSHLVAAEVTQPLGMNDTAVRFSAKQQERFIRGHPDIHVPPDWWDHDALAGAGGLRSTAADMLSYLEANLHPERLNGKSGNAATLPQAIALSHELRSEASEGMKIALAWFYDPSTGNYLHEGATNGFSAYAFFNPKGDYAAVVLMNAANDPRGSFVERLAEHISERFAGVPAVSLSYR